MLINFTTGFSIYYLHYNVAQQMRDLHKEFKYYNICALLDYKNSKTQFITNELKIIFTYNIFEHLDHVIDYIKQKLTKNKILYYISMPFKIVKVKGGYKVKKDQPGRPVYFSNNPLSKDHATKQLIALNLAKA